MAAGQASRPGWTPMANCAVRGRVTMMNNGWSRYLRRRQSLPGRPGPVHGL